LRRAAALAALLIAFAFPAGAVAKIPRPYQQCGQLNVVYPHGVGRANARDAVTAMGQPVTTFKRSTAIYNRAMSYNKRLDADKDGVACEKQ
jgi:excalibur calcium-binding domain-containing protein